MCKDNSATMPVSAQANVSVAKVKPQSGGRSHQPLAQDARRAVPSATRDEAFAEATRKSNNPAFSAK